MKIIEKPWGREIWVAHTNQYALKIIEFKKGSRSSLQFHRIKKEHIYLDSGKVRLEFEDDSGKLKEIIFSPGNVIEIVPGTKHRVTALEDSRFIEVSTPELDDVVRVEDDYGRTISRQMQKSIVIFGAGSTGRAHIGLLAWQAGFNIIFVDKNKELIDALREAKKYQVRIYGEKEEGITVDGFRVYYYLERDQIAQEIANACLVLTSVFAQNLPDVAKTIAMGITKCRLLKREEPINFIACENMADSSSNLEKHVRNIITDTENLQFMNALVGFPDCMISRVVPKHERDPLFLVTEDYNEWTVDKKRFKGKKPSGLHALELVDNQQARLERKLYVHNGGHATAGYFAYHRHWEYIHESLKDPLVVRQTLGALNELGEVVVHKHGFKREEIAKYKEDLKRRGALEALKDRVARVVRDPIRKLSATERLIAPVVYAEKNHLPNKFIVQTIVAVLKFHNPQDQQSKQVLEMINKEGLPATLQSISGISMKSDLNKKILDAWDHWDQIINYRY